MAALAQAATLNFTSMTRISVKTVKTDAQDAIQLLLTAHHAWVRTSFWHPTIHAMPLALTVTSPTHKQILAMRVTLRAWHAQQMFRIAQRARAQSIACKWLMRSHALMLVLTVTMQMTRRKLATVKFLCKDFYLTSSYEACDASCATCSNDSTFCTKCAVGYQSLTINTQLSCALTCPDTYYSDETNTCQGDFNLIVIV